MLVKGSTAIEGFRWPGSLGDCRTCGARDRGCYPVEPNCSRHVLQALLAEIFKADLNLAADMADDRLGHKDTARLG